MGNRRKVVADIGRALTRGMQGMASTMPHSGSQATRVITISTMRQAQHASIPFTFGSTDSSTGLCKLGRISFFMFISFHLSPSIGMGIWECARKSDARMAGPLSHDHSGPLPAVIRFLPHLMFLTRWRWDRKVSGCFTLAKIATFNGITKSSVAYPNECHTMGR